jgi:uncharacterized linocin/CFP29 family protein
MNLGRDRIHWTAENWELLDQAVKAEVERVKIAAAILPRVGDLPADTRAVPAEIIGPELAGDDERPEYDAPVAHGSLAVDEQDLTPLVELSSRFELTPAQAEEPGLETALALALRAANLAAQVEDRLIFGNEDLPGRLKHVQVLGKVRQPNLLNAPDPEKDVTIKPAPPDKLGESAFSAVVSAMALLEDLGHAGPYALVLNHRPYAEIHGPFYTTLATPADRIRALVTAGFRVSSAVPADTGLLFSIGGNTMDLVLGMDMAVAFLQVNQAGRYLLRAVERFALRLKDKSAVVKLVFQRAGDQPTA